MWFTPFLRSLRGLKSKKKKNSVTSIPLSLSLSLFLVIYVAKVVGCKEICTYLVLQLRLETMWVIVPLEVLIFLKVLQLK